MVLADLGRRRAGNGTADLASDAQRVVGHGADTDRADRLASPTNSRIESTDGLDPDKVQIAAPRLVMKNAERFQEKLLAKGFRSVGAKMFVVGRATAVSSLLISPMPLLTGRPRMRFVTRRVCSPVVGSW